MTEAQMPDQESRESPALAGRDIRSLEDVDKLSRPRVREALRCGGDS